MDREVVEHEDNDLGLVLIHSSHHSSSSGGKDLPGLWTYGVYLADGASSGDPYR